jgi:hypothetical protein
MRGCPKLEVLEQPYIKMSVNSRRYMAHLRLTVIIFNSPVWGSKRDSQSNHHAVTKGKRGLYGIMP